MSLKDKILRYYKQNHTLWISSAYIERLVQEKTNKIASNASRRLRELHEAGELDRQYRIVNGRRLAYYRLAESPLKISSQQVAFFDNYGK